MSLTYKAMVIGASEGGMNALITILSQLPTTLSVPMIVVLHQKEDSDDLLACYLSKKSPFRVIYAESNSNVEAGVVHLAPPGYHLLLEEHGVLSLSIDPPVNYSIPSIDVLFESAAEVYQHQLIGILLTGSNADGAKGLKKINQLGGYSIVQDPNSAECDVMPRAALAMTTVNQVLSLDKISKHLGKLLTDTRSY